LHRFIASKDPPEPLLHQFIVPQAPPEPLLHRFVLPADVREPFGKVAAEAQASPQVSYAAAADQRRTNDRAKTTRCGNARENFSRKKPCKAADLTCNCLSTVDQKKL
jgi:hypothetical protein